MTRTLKSVHTEKLGIGEVVRVCALARMIFRPTPSDDVGIDGFIELVDRTMPTGVLVGVQIKSGPSFVNKSGDKFTLKADQDHFGYWARCSFPVIAVIYSPEFEKAAWLDVTCLCSDSRIVNGPYSETIAFTHETAFTPVKLASEITDLAMRYTYQRRTLWQVEQLTQPRRPQSDFAVPSLQVNSEKEAAWYSLIDKLFSVDTDEQDIADVGYRLSWYFPSVSKNLQDALIERLSAIDDLSLTKIIGAIHVALEDNADKVAELIVDLLAYIPGIAARIESLLAEDKIPMACREAAIQTIEVIEEEEKPELRSSYRSP